MRKKIAAQLMLFLVLFSLITIAFSAQPVRACLNPGFIPKGHDVKVSYGDITLEFTGDVIASGQLTVTAASSYPPPPSPGPGIDTTYPSVASLDSGFFLGTVWNVKVTARFTGNVIIGIKYHTLIPPFQMFQTDVVPGDVNFDGKVNLADLAIIVKALGSTPNSPRWNPNCDLNGDNKVDLQDLCIAIRNFGRTSTTTWTDITLYPGAIDSSNNIGASNSIDGSNNIIYGITNHFSLFGVH